MNNKGIPSLRISTSSSCNCRCSFCQVDGDFSSDHANIEPKTDQQLGDFFINAVSRFWECGVRHYSLTGGEPLLNQSVTFQVAHYISKKIQQSKLSKGDYYLRLNTNGVFLKDNVDKIHNYFDFVKISLPSLNIKNYAKITSSNRLNDVIEGIKLLDLLNHPVRIHMVVIKDNLHEIKPIIQFCEKIKCIKELKIFDLSEYSELWRGNISAIDYWKNQFVDISIIENEIKKTSQHLGKMFSIGGYGNPMNVYQYSDNLTVRFRNSFLGAHYGQTCSSCPAFKFCGDGHCNLEIGPNKVIKVCRPKEGKIFHTGEEDKVIKYFQNLKFINK